MDWITLFRRVGVTHPTRELSAVAEEYQRKLELKRSSISAITLNATAKSLICVELACKACKQPYNPNAVISLSGESKRNFSRAQQTIEKMVVGRRTGGSVKELAIRLGCSDVAAMAEQALDGLRVSLEQSVPDARRGSIDVSTPVFIGAAIMAVCRILKFKLDKRKLRDETRCTLADLEKRAEEMMQNAKSAVEDGQKSAQKKRTHSLAFLDNVEENAEDVPSKRHRPGVGDIQEDLGAALSIPFFSYRPLPDFYPWREGIIRTANQALTT